MSTSRKKTYKTPGRKGVYDDTCPKRGYELAAIGLTNEKLALAFGVDVTTIGLWLKEREEFSDAVRAGKYEFDHGVEKTLLQRAVGYETEEVKEETRKDKNGNIISRVETRVRKQVAPDVTAMIFWLKNRKKSEWADVHKQEITSNINLSIPETKDIENLLTKEEIQYARKIAKLKLKQVRGVSSN